jgi:hypothetical protein
MEFIPNKIDLALMLWDNGEFIATKMNGERVSLYRYNKKFYVIWYTKENHLEKIEIVTLTTAKKMFENYPF